MTNKEIVVTAEDYEFDAIVELKEVELAEKGIAAEALYADIPDTERPYDLNLSVDLSANLKVGLPNNKPNLFKLILDAFSIEDFLLLERNVYAGADPAKFSEALTFELNRKLLSQITSIQVIKLGVEKPLLDSFNSQDRVDKEIAKAFLDTKTYTDRISFGVNKALQSTSQFSEVKSFVVQKSLRSNLDISDDIFGEATLDDDQTISFLKVIQTSSDVYDVFSRVVDYKRVVSSQFTKSEIISKQFSKALRSNIGSTDNSVKVFGKALTSNIDPTDSKQLIVAKVLSDSFAKSDSVSKMLSKIVNDSIGLTDFVSYLKFFNEDADDSASISDSISIALLFNRTASDLLALTEEKSIVVNKSNTDTINTSHSLEVFKESYVVAGYFAERYVGEVFLITEE